MSLTVAKRTIDFGSNNLFRSRAWLFAVAVLGALALRLFGRELDGAWRRWTRLLRCSR